MPPHIFALLILTVIAAAGATIALWSLAGLPLAALSLLALCAALAAGWRASR